MYDLASPSMQAQFNLINKSNQSIKLSVYFYSKSSKKKNLSDYTYNKKVIFKYALNIKNSGYLKSEKITKLWEDHLSFKSNNCSKLWPIIMWQSWLEKN